MKLSNLLVPTDFSDQASATLHYALLLAKETGAVLHVLNSYYIPINTIETDYVADQAIWLEQSRQRALEEMQLLEERYLKESGVIYETHVHPGPDMGDINETIREKKIDLVVMGTQHGGDLEHFFGELYTHAIRHAKAPVLLVPETSAYVRPQQVVFTTDLKPLENQAPLENLAGILANFNPQLTMLHVHKAGEEPEEKQKDEFKELSANLASFSPRLVLVEADDIQDGILGYAKQAHTDWLVAISHNYGLLEGLFHSSHTKKLARQTPVPLLVSHE